MSPLLMLIALTAPMNAQGTDVRGVVVDTAGKPVAGATVLLVKNSYLEEDQTVRTTKSAADGRFHFEKWTGRSSLWMVVAHKKGHAIGGVSILRNPNDRFAQVDSANVRIRLPRPQPIGVRVTGPMNVAVAGARATLRSLRLSSQSYLYVGEPVAKHLPVTMDSKGVVQIDFLPPDVSFSLRVTSATYGAQQFPLKNTGKEQSVKLRTAGRLEGTVTADDPRAVGGLRVMVYSRPSGGNLQGRAIGWASLKTDGKGRFVIPAIARGNASVDVRPNPDFPFLSPQQQTRIEIRTGEPATVHIALKRGVPLTGRVVEDKTGDPVPGVSLFVGGSRSATTDAKGVFHGYARPGNAYVTVTSVPKKWLPPFETFQSFQIPANAKSHKVPTITVKRAVPLKGAVVDETGKPLPGARVVARWQKRNGPYSTLGSDYTFADDAGRFVLRQVPGDSMLGLTVTTANRATKEMFLVQPGNKKPVRLQALRDAAVTLTGRIVDADGQPVPDARVEVRKATRIPSGQIYGAGVVTMQGQRELTTDKDGTYRTPVKLPRNEKYALAVGAPGMLRQETGYLTPSRTGDPVRFKDIVLSREKSVEGIVVDPAGKPIAGATVWSHGHARGRRSVRVTATTKADGRFLLKNLHPQAPLVFADKDGYRLRGGAIRKAGGTVRITLIPDGAESKEPLMHSVDWRGEKREKLLKKLILPVYPEFLKSAGDFFPKEAMTRLAPFDRKWCLDQLGKLRSNGSRADVLIALGEIDDALETAGLIKNPYSKSFKMLSIADACTDKSRKKRILADALVAARSIPKPSQRVLLLSNVAERLYDLGDRAGARKVVNDGQKIATQLAPTEWSGYARGNFAETLALFDPAAAFKLLKDIKDESVLRRHAGNTAHELAGINPAEAERFLKLIKKDHGITPFAVRICYRMAPVDLKRARRIADAIDDRESPGGNAHAYGVMAMGLVKKDPATARKLLRQAFDKLKSADSRGYSVRYEFGVAFILTRYAETVHPERLRDYFWQAAATHSGPAGEYFSPSDAQQQSDENISQFVVLLGMYDQFPELRREIMAPVFKRWAGYTDSSQFYRRNAVFTAMALTDPQRTIAWHSTYYRKISKEHRRYLPQPWMTVADVFGFGGEPLGKRITEEVFHRWVIDKEDY